MVKGFTLIELLVTVTILAIISALSIPFLSYLIEKNRVDSDLFTVSNIIQTARSKAISDNTSITICGEHISSKCSRDWSNLIVYSKASKDIIYNANLSASFSSITWSAFQNKPGLSIGPTGYTHHQNGTLYLCHNSKPRLNRALIVSKSGRVTIDSKSAKLIQRCSN